MTSARRGSGRRWALGGAAVAALALLELAGTAHGGGAILVTLALWTAFAQGCVAAVAAGELTHSRWVAAVRPELLSAAWLLPMLALLFLLLWPQPELYGWTATPGRWLNRPFFFARNLGLLLAVAAVAGLFADRVARGAASARPLAVVYLFLFAASQTLVAFDWIMSLSWPWVSSMLGMFFSVEALYAGLALSCVLFARRDRVERAAGGTAWRATGRDLGVLLFGFSILWGGLFFAQFILLWYGNLPDEVGFIATRLAAWPTRALAPAFIAACFGAPFVLLLAAPPKQRPAVVAAVAVAVLLGLAAERLYLVLPALPLRWGVLAAENLILIAVWWGAVALARPLPERSASLGGGD